MSNNYYTMFYNEIWQAYAVFLRPFFNWIHFSLFWGRTHFVSLIYHFIPRHTLGEIVNYLLPFVVYLNTPYKLDLLCKFNTSYLYSQSWFAIEAHACQEYH